MNHYRIDLEHVKGMCVECGDCWEWKGSVSDGGVPKINVYVGRGDNGRTVLSGRRVVWELAKRPALARKVLLTPSCGNTRCLNPKHLVTTNHSEVAVKVGARIEVKLKKSAKCSGREIKLNAKKAAEIRASSLTAKELSKQYDVGVSSINRVRQGRTWSPPNPFGALVLSIRGA